MSTPVYVFMAKSEIIIIEDSSLREPDTLSGEVILSK